MPALQLDDASLASLERDIAAGQVAMFALGRADGHTFDVERDCIHYKLRELRRVRRERTGTEDVSKVVSLRPWAHNELTAVSYRAAVAALQPVSRDDQFKILARMIVEGSLSRQQAGEILFAMLIEEVGALETA